MVDDYLYNGNGALLALFLIGISMTVKRESLQNEGFVARFDYRIIGSVAVVIIGVCLLNINRIRSAWYADLGSVQMARVELVGFPTDQWTDIKIVPQLETAETSLHSALQYHPNNPTANYRLGMISMLRQDFETASMNLEVAYREAPRHRGIIKNLGYCYVWLGKLDEAKSLLENIPEAQKELNVYVWWWDVHGRRDLAINAFQLASRLRTETDQP